MIQNAFLSASKFLLAFILLISMSEISMAQRNMKPRLPGSEYQNFLKTQWWLGLKFGSNLTQPDPRNRYSSIVPVNYEEELLEKEYENFTDLGVLIGLDLSFYHRGFSIGISPVYKRIVYQYGSTIEWTGDTDVETFETAYDVIQSASFIELPLTLKYELIKQGKLRPFLFLGMQYSFSIDATKETDISHTDYITGSPEPYDGGFISLDVSNEFQNYFGALGGLGFGWDVGNIRTVFEASYAYGLSSITNTDNRFSENGLVTIGETNDETFVHGINASLSVVFPLRYIDNTFSSR